MSKTFKFDPESSSKGFKKQKISSKKNRKNRTTKNRGVF
jgi:hypothetical protein